MRSLARISFDFSQVPRIDTDELGVANELTLRAWVCVVSPRQIGQGCSIAARYLTMPTLDENESTTMHSAGGQKGTSALVLAAVKLSVEPRAVCASAMRWEQGAVSVTRTTCLLVGFLHPLGMITKRVMMHMMGDDHGKREEGKFDSKFQSTKRKLLWDDRGHCLTGPSDLEAETENWS